MSSSFRYSESAKFQPKYSNSTNYRDNSLILPSGLRFEPDKSKRHVDFRPNSESWNEQRITPRNNFRSYNDNYEYYRPRGRKRSNYFRENFDRQPDRKYYKSKFNNIFSGSNKPFEYKGGASHGFKAPKHLSTNQQRKRHLKNLRKTAAELASKDDVSFVYKPGMIGLLRPNTPFNRTKFLAKDKRFSPKFDESEENNEKE